MTRLGLTHILSLVLLRITESATRSSDITQDSTLDTEQLLRKYKYPAETHFITTADGYILRLHRIAKPGGRPVLLQHGLLDTSAAFIIMRPEQSLGYYLHDQGYDVWMGNARGNRYSRNHTKLNPDTDQEFWNFSWHEIGVYDIPAIIDYVLGVTGFEKLFYIGHSQGTTVMFVMCSMLPEYNEKIVLAHALAPIVFTNHIRIRLLAYWQTFVKRKSSTLLEFMPNANSFKKLCLTNATETVCVETYFQVVGTDVKQFNRSTLPIILGHIPAGVSMKQILHSLQLIKSGCFCRYDHNKGNQKIYGQLTPPAYDLKKVTTPVALHYGANDLMSIPADVLKLSKLLPNVVEVHKVNWPQWNHMDFIWAIDAPELLYEYVEELNRRFH